MGISFLLGSRLVWLRNGPARELIYAGFLLGVSGPEGQGRKMLRVSGLAGASPAARPPLS